MAKIKEIFVPFNVPADGTTSFVSQTFTIDAAATTILATTDGSIAVSKITPCTPIDMVMAVTNTLGIVNPGANTAFTRTFTWTPDMYGKVFKISIQLGMGLNCSAYTSGSPILGQVLVSAVERDSGRIVIPVLTFNTPQLFSVLSATGTQVLIMEAFFKVNTEIYDKNAIDITVKTSGSNFGTTATCQEGLLPIFCYNQLNTMKLFSPSGIMFHIQEDVDV